MGYHKTTCPRCYGDRKLLGEDKCRACEGQGYIAAWEGLDRKVSYRFLEKKDPPAREPAGES